MPSNDKLSKKKSKDVKLRKSVQRKKKAATIDVKIVDIESVHPNNFNYNRQTNFIFEKQKESIRKYGFVEPIACRVADEEAETWEIVNGEHRYLALQEMFKDNETVYLDVQHTIILPRNKIPIQNLGNITREEAQQLCIALNEIKGKPNQDDLAKNLAELHVKSIDLSALPYTEIEIESYLRLADDILDFDDGDEKDEEEEEESSSDVDDTYTSANFELIAKLFAVDKIERSELEFIHETFVDFLKSNNILRSEGNKGLVELLKFWKQNT